MRHGLLCASISNAVLALAGLSAAQPDPVVQNQASAAAVQSAQAWLALVDAGKYLESWERSAEYFRGAVTQDQWVRSMQSVRRPLGDLKSRELSSAELATSLPGAPDGQYVVMQFDASFANKQSAVETVTTVLEADGRWRAVGYFIR